MNKRPCLFLFDGGAEGVKAPALKSFTGALLAAISTADPHGAIVAELRGGLSTLSGFTDQISEVHSGPGLSGQVRTHDMALFRLLLWDMAEALSRGARAPTSRAILDVLRMGREECLALSDIPDDVREGCDAVLVRCRGYIGSCPIDPGNPIMRRAFYDGLMHLAFISDGAITQQRTVEGEEYLELEGAQDFKPKGLKWIDYIYGKPPHPFLLQEAPLSPSGERSLDRLKRKTHTTVEGRIFRKLSEALWTDRAGQTYRFAAVESARDILEAVLPDGKFTEYLFNRDHDKGAAKARFVMDVLGFEPEDWRYLAAQFYDGLLLSEPRDLVIQHWQGGYGARFNVFVEVTSRAGNRGIMSTGWMLKPQMLPQLVTAKPGHRKDGVVTPPTPAVLLPQAEGDTWWESLFLLADKQGRANHEATLPTPILLENDDFSEEGEPGSASVLIADARRGFAKWLIKTGHGDRVNGGAVIHCNLQFRSLERAKAYAVAFARVLALNGVPSHVKTNMSFVS
jgi:hypothetical protein